MISSGIKIDMCHGCGINIKNGTLSGWGYVRINEDPDFEFNLCPACIKSLDYGKGMEGSIFELIRTIK